MSRLSVRIPDSMRDSMQKFRQENNYLTDSELIRDALRDKIQPKKDSDARMKQEEGEPT